MRDKRNRKKDNLPLTIVSACKGTKKNTTMQIPRLKKAIYLHSLVESYFPPTYERNVSE